MKENAKSGGSAVRRLRTTLREAGALGPRRTKKTAGKKTTPSTTSSTSLTSPFDIKVNRRKHDVVGRKVKGTQGHPTIARTRAMEKRMETLLPEYKQRGRVSAFVDRRFGETDPTMSLEEKMVQRFARERLKASGKKSMYTLDDDDEMEELTHMGQSLSAMDDFDRTEIELGVDNDDDDRGQLDRSITSRLNFGGFAEDSIVLGGGGSEGAEDDRQKTKREIMQEVISKSKFHKGERQKAKLEDADLIDKLDKELKEIRDLLEPAMHGRSRTKDGNAAETPESLDTDNNGESSPKDAIDGIYDTNDEGQDYDSIIATLAADTRARPTNRRKTAEELAAEAKQKLEEFEAARQRRMRGITDDGDEEDLDGNTKMDDMTGHHRMKKMRKNFSGDDLGSNVETEVNQRKQRQPIAYVNGKLFVDGQEYHAPRTRSADDDDDDSNGGDAEIDEEDDDQGNIAAEGEEEEEEDNDDDDEEEEENEDEEDDDTSGLEYDSNASDLEEEQELPSESTQTIPQQKLDRRREAQKVQRVKEAALQELPYVLPAPQTHNDLIKIIENRPKEDVNLAIERLRTLYHVSLAPGNREKLQLLLSVLIEHIEHVCDEQTALLDHVEITSPHILALINSMPNWAVEICRARLGEWNRQIAEKIAERAAGEGTGWPLRSAMVLLGLFAKAFPATDFRHPVLSPARLYISQVLTRCPLFNERDAARTLVICATVYQLQRESKRYFPEALAALRKALDIVLPLCTGLEGTPKGDERPMLDLLTAIEDGSPEDASQLRLDLASSIVTLLGQLMDVYNGYTAFHAIAAPVIATLASHLRGVLPRPLKIAVLHLVKKLKGHSAEAEKKLYPLTMQRRKAVPLKEYTPRVDEKFQPGKTNDPDHQRSEIKKLQKQHKKQVKGAVRELRKDSQFIATIRRTEQAERDAAYKARIKNIESMLQNEQGDLKATSGKGFKTGRKRQRGVL